MESTRFGKDVIQSSLRGKKCESMSIEDLCSNQTKGFVWIGCKIN